MKAILEFNLRDIDEAEAHQRMLKASDMLSFLYDIEHEMLKESTTLVEFRFRYDLAKENINLRELFTPNFIRRYK